MKTTPEERGWKHDPKLTMLITKGWSHCYSKKLIPTKVKDE